MAWQVRCNAFLEVGGSPTWTLTEDYALGMELKKYGWHCRYVQEYLAIGEAPEQIRNCYQQRSRWCKVSPAILGGALCLPCCGFGKKCPDVPAVWVPSLPAEACYLRPVLQLQVLADAVRLHL